jgi:uncharacterized coiled-coil DUF342 family protein
LSTSPKNRLLTDLYEKLTPLNEQKNLLETQMNDLAVKRDTLNGKFRDLRDEIEQLRDDRNEINEKVRELKQERSRLTAKTKEKAEEIRKLCQDRKELSGKRPPRSHLSLQEEVDSIDWEIQTTSHTLEEDNELVGKVKQLEVQLDIHRKYEHLVKRIRDLRAEVTRHKTVSESCHQALTAKARVGQETHARMLARIEEGRKTKTEADDMHRRFLEAKQKAMLVNEKLTNVSNEIKRLQGEIREEQQKGRKQDEDALRQSLEEKAREKLKRGEKLSWQEFQLLSEKGLTTQD